MKARAQAATVESLLCDLPNVTMTNNRNLPQALLLAGLMISLCGCAARYEDVSGIADYSSMIGAKCVTKQALKIHGVARELGRSKKTDYLVITATPGIGGPEVIFQDALPANTPFVIVRARKCTNCLPPHTELILSIGQIEKYAGFEIAASDQVFKTKHSLISCVN